MHGRASPVRARVACMTSYGQKEKPAGPRVLPARLLVRRSGEQTDQRRDQMVTSPCSKATLQPLAASQSADGRGSGVAMSQP
jgi:hypothetical protein